MVIRECQIDVIDRGSDSLERHIAHIYYVHIMLTYNVSNM